MPRFRSGPSTAQPRPGCTTIWDSKLFHCLAQRHLWNARFSFWERRCIWIIAERSAGACCWGIWNEYSRSGVDRCSCIWPTRHSRRSPITRGSTTFPWTRAHSAAGWPGGLSACLPTERRPGNCRQRIAGSAGCPSTSQSGQNRLSAVAAGASKGVRRIHNPPQVNNLPREYASGDLTYRAGGTSGRRSPSADSRECRVCGPRWARAE